MVQTRRVHARNFRVYGEKKLHAQLNVTSPRWPRSSCGSRTSRAAARSRAGSTPRSLSMCSPAAWSAGKCRRRCGRIFRNCWPRKNIDELETTTAECIDWFNYSRLHGEVGMIPLVELEENYHQHQTVPATPEAAVASLYETRGDSAILPQT